MKIRTTSTTWDRKPSYQPVATCWLLVQLIVSMSSPNGCESCPQLHGKVAPMVTANIVGSGPNGLAAAVTLAQAGVDVTVYEGADTPGGGARSTEATVPGLLHDHCAGFHPLAVDNAFMTSAQLADYGLQWAWPEVQYAHPLDNGDGAAAYRSVAETADALDAPAWKRVFGPLAADFPAIRQDFLQPMLRLPDAPVK